MLLDARLLGHDGKSEVPQAPGMLRDMLGRALAEYAGSAQAAHIEGPLCHTFEPTGR